MSKVNLSYNQLENVDFLANYTNLKIIQLNNNNIINIEKLFVNNNLNNVELFDVSFNTLNKNSNFKIEMIGSEWKRIYLNHQYLHYFSLKKNDRMIKKSGSNIFLKSLLLYIFMENGDYFVDCHVQIEFIKRNILVNLADYKQIETFFDKCHFYSLDI